MKYTVYNVRTKRFHKEYETLRGAKIAVSRLNKTTRNEFACIESELFQEQFNKWTTVQSLVGGHEVQIREQDVGTCCDPSTETYWSM